MDLTAPKREKHTTRPITKYITSTIQTLDQLKENIVTDDKYHKLLDSSLDGVILLSGTKIIYANQSEAKLLGYDNASELIGHDMTDNLPDEEKERIRQRTLSRQRGEPVPDRYELKLKRKDGKIIEIETATSAINYEGKPAVLAQTRDVTAAKRFEKQVMALHEHATSISHASSLKEVSQTILDVVESVVGFNIGAFMIVEEDDLIFYEGRGTLTYIGRIPIMGKGITAKAAREMHAVLVNDLRNEPNFLRGSMNSLSELAVPVILDDEVVAVLNFESQKTDAFDEVDQKLLETLAVHVSSAIYRIREIDRIKRQEEEKAKELMDGANKLVSMVRHDLRGPLQTIQNAAYLMTHKFIGAEEFTKKINDSIEYAVKILDDLKVMMGPQQLKRESVDLNDLLKGCLENAIVTEGVEVEARYGVPVIAEVDSYKIRRVMDNLVKNAVEAMQSGGKLGIKVEASHGVAILTVSDTGKGIPEDVALRMFTPFYTTKKAGTGLGLAICKQVIEAHSGRIDFESKEGRGTVFTVTLPMKESESLESDSVQTTTPVAGY